MPKLDIEDFLPDVGEETGTEEANDNYSKIAYEEDFEENLTIGEPIVKASAEIHEKEYTARSRKNRVYYIGMFSAALSMVVMGVSFIVSLFTAGGIPNVLKLSPIVLVFLGLEIFLNCYFQKGRRLRFDISGYAASLIMVAIAAGLSALSVSVSNSDSARINLERRYENELQNRLSGDFRSIANIKDISVLFSSYESDISGYSTIDDIKDTDKLELKIFFRNTQKTLVDFSADCHDILEVLKNYGLPFGNISFIADDGLNSIRVNINGKFEMDISENELARLSFYFAGDFTEDLIDYE
ncbi:MAG: hypothetical protein LBR74_05430 [Eubacterium sp.]|jgi:hypothetical protein|nr:hypothetical protein [Eubacterium sp.]